MLGGHAPPRIVAYVRGPIAGTVLDHSLIPVSYMKPYIVPALALALAVAFGAPTAWAQQPEGTVQHVPVWVQHLGDQLEAELTSPSVAVRQQALQHIAYFASFYGDKLDLTATVPMLLDLVANDANEQVQLLAVAGLRAIGDEGAMQQLRRLATVHEPMMPRVQLVIFAALADFYGTETFEGDAASAQLAKNLFEYYTGPRVVVSPPVVVHQ